MVTSFPGAIVLSDGVDLHGFAVVLFGVITGILPFAVIVVLDDITRVAFTGSEGVLLI